VPEIINVTRRLDINFNLRGIVRKTYKRILWTNCYVHAYTVQSVQLSWAQSSKSDCWKRNTVHSSGTQSFFASRRSRDQMTAGRPATLPVVLRGIP
jgi:hypothetical protein